METGFFIFIGICFVGVVCLWLWNAISEVRHDQAADAYMAQAVKRSKTTLITPSSITTLPDQSRPITTLPDRPRSEILKKPAPRILRKTGSRPRTNCLACGKDVAMSKSGTLADHSGLSFNQGEVGGHGGERCLGSFTSGKADLIKRLEGLIYRGKRDLKWARDNRGQPANVINRMQAELNTHIHLLARL